MTDANYQFLIEQELKRLNLLEDLYIWETEDDNLITFDNCLSQEDRIYYCDRVLLLLKNIQNISLSEESNLYIFKILKSAEYYE